MSVAATPTSAGFSPVDPSVAHAHGNAAGPDHVESPSLSSGNALARFEFEPDKSKDGTKVLMVEWEEDETTRPVDGDWEISWEGKRTVLPAREQPAGDDVPINRLYFLLGAGVSVPTAVLLQKGAVTWRTNPLPAIFAPDLSASARQAGKKGVLHTIWAKKRIQTLQREINSEAKTNTEGVGLQMAVAEKEWIERDFGVRSRPGALTIPTAGTSGAGLHSPTSPRTPGGGRLMEMLKGLRLETSERDKVSSAPLRDESNAPQTWHNPLSPEGSDVAVSSFGSFAALKGVPNASHLAAKPAQRPSGRDPSTQPLPQSQRRIAVQRPPDSLQRHVGGVGSLNAVAAGAAAAPFENTSLPRPSRSSSETKEEDDLFALPISPRSPEMAKGPFSFATQDSARSVRGEKA